MKTAEEILEIIKSQMEDAASAEDRAHKEFLSAVHERTALTRLYWALGLYKKPPEGEEG